METGIYFKLWKAKSIPRPELKSSEQLNQKWVESILELKKKEREDSGLKSQRAETNSDSNEPINPMPVG